MAIYQYRLTVLPRTGLLSVLGEIPEKLDVDFKKSMEAFLKGDWNDDPDDYEIFVEKCWSEANINPKDIIKLMDEKLDRANWGNSGKSNKWKTITDKSDNDASLHTDENQTFITEFAFRADLKEPGLVFLFAMINLAAKHDFLLMDAQGNLAEPDPEKVFGLIKQSNAFRFVKDPVQYFTDLANGEIVIE